MQQLDRYGRTLAYVYLEDGTFVNAWLCGGDDNTAECEASRVVSEAPAGGEGGGTGVVEVTYEIDCRKARSFCSPRNSYV